MTRKATCFVIIGLVACLWLTAAPIHAEWTENGVAICTNVNTKSSPQIISDGNGGAIVTWGEYRGSWNISAQRVGADGVVLWTANGAVVCGFGGTQRFPMLVPDGSGGAIVAWYDNRGGDYDIYAQRLDANGNAQWTADGVPIMTAAGNQYNYGIASDGAGGAIVSIYDIDGSGDIHAQRVAADGTVLWGAGGLDVSTTTDSDLSPQIAADGAHGAYIVFSRNVAGTVYTYANRVNAGGTVLWGASSVEVCTAGGSQYDIKVVGVPGGAMVSWQDNRSSSNIYAQLIDSTGTVQWGATGTAVCTASGAQETPRIAADGSGGAVIAWVDYRNGPDPDIYAQRMSGAGSALWTADGVAVCTAVYAQTMVDVAADGAGGAVLAWRDGRGGLGSTYICMQRIDGAGAPVWMADGKAVCTAASSRQDPVIASDGLLGGIAAWTDQRSGTGAIYAHRENPIVATFLESFAAGVDGGCVELSWVLSEAGTDVGFFIERATAGGAGFKEIVSPVIARSGLSFSFADCSCEPGDAARYRVEVEDNGARVLLFETDTMVLPPAPLALFQNRPNPFNPSTTIAYYLPSAAHVVLEIYDPAGRDVAHLVDAVQAKGDHEVGWNGRNSAGALVGSGVYFYRLTAGKETLTKKMVLLK